MSAANKTHKKNGNISIAIFASIGATIIFLISLAVIFFMLGNATEELDRMADQRYQSLQLANEMRQSSDELTRLVRTYSLTADSRYQQQYNDIIAVRNGDKPRADGEQISLLDLMAKNGFTKQEFDQLQEMQKRSAALVQLETQAMQAVQSNGANGRQHAQNILFDDEYHRHKTHIMEPMQTFLNILDERTQKEKDSAKSKVLLLQNLFLIALFAALAALAGTIWLGWRQMIKQLGCAPVVLDHVAQELASGNLRVTIPPAAPASALGRMNEMAQQLRSLIGPLNESVHQINDASHALASHVQEGTSTATDTSSAATAMAASVEQMSVSIGQIADSAQESAELAQASADKAGQGDGIIASSANEMEKIAKLVDEVSGRIHHLSNNSERISGVVEVIREVAEQTNLLALNAAIEAARAGESGRGFAVVADEVRKLAERTATATDEISEMATSIQTDSHNAEDAMQRASEGVDSGVSYSTQAATTMREIRAESLHTCNVIQSMSDAMAEQNSSSRQIATQVEQVAVNSEESQRVSEQISSLSDDLKSLAEKLAEVTRAFQNYRI